MEPARKKVLLIVLAVAFGGCTVLSGLQERPATGIRPPQQPKVADYRTEAIVCARLKVKEQLKVPSTADFPSITKDMVTVLADGRYTLKSYVDAQNSFGVPMRSEFFCDMTLTNPNECTGNCQIQ